MKKLYKIVLVGCLAFGVSACSNTVRYMTATQWTNTPGEGNARVFYLTYWEGTCSKGFAGIGTGCSRGVSKIKRCNAKPDNTMQCVDEEVANQAFAQ